jgi:hypothetical protein
MLRKTKISTDQKIVPKKKITIKFDRVRFSAASIPAMVEQRTNQVPRKI